MVYQTQFAFQANAGINAWQFEFSILENSNAISIKAINGNGKDKVKKYFKKTI